MNTLTPEVVQDILRTYPLTRNSPFKTARLVGVSVADVFATIDAHEGQLNVAQERYGGFGRPELQQFIVARRQARESGWENSDPDIARARSDYEAGTHEMATGRDGAWLILYSFPRRRVAKGRENYFKPEVSA